MQYVICQFYIQWSFKSNFIKRFYIKDKNSIKKIKLYKTPGKLENNKTGRLL